MITFIVFLIGLAFYWKPIYYALRASWLYYKVGEEAQEYLDYRNKFLDWFVQAWQLMKP